MSGYNFDFRIIAEDSTYKEYHVVDNRTLGPTRIVKYQEAMELMERNEEFRKEFFSVLKNGTKGTNEKHDSCSTDGSDSVQPYFFEVVPITRETYSSENFSFVLITAPDLQGIQQDET